MTETIRRWIPVCANEETDPEDVMRFDDGGRTHAICRAPAGGFHAINRLCGYEQVHLSGEPALGDLIEYPNQTGRFSYRSGAAVPEPVCVNWTCHPVWVAECQEHFGLETP